MPQIRLRDAGAVLRTIAQIRARDSEGTLRTISRVRMRNSAGVLKTVFNLGVGGSADVNLSTYDLYASRSSRFALTGIVTTTTVTSSVLFGTGPYTYHWERLTGSTNVIAVTPNNADTAFSATPVVPNSRVATFRLKVTDSLAVVKYSDPISLELEWIHAS